MSRSEFELPPEALALVEQVRALETRAEEAKQELAAELAGIREAAGEERREVARQQAALAHDREALEALLENPLRGVEFIADAWADYERAHAQCLGVALQYKSHPAKSAAKEMRAKGKEMAELRRELKRAQWVLRLYEWHFPWLTELRDLEEEQSFVASEDDAAQVADGELADPAQHWLSEEEYRALSEVERNQRALNRYLRSRKTPWQLGRDYERYIGYLREAAGARQVSGHLRGVRGPRPRPDRHTPRRCDRGHPVQALGQPQDDSRETRLSAVRDGRGRTN